MPTGYSSILRPLGAQIAKQSILTKCPVKKIHWKRKKTFTGLETVDENSEDEHSDDSERTVTEVPTGKFVAPPWSPTPAAIVIILQATCA